MIGYIILLCVVSGNIEIKLRLQDTTKKLGQYYFVSVIVLVYMKLGRS